MADNLLDQLAQLDQLGFVEVEARRLIALRRDVARRTILEMLLDRRRVAFLQWLVERGRVSEWFDA